MSFTPKSGDNNNVKVSEKEINKYVGLWKVHLYSDTLILVYKDHNHNLCNILLHSENVYKQGALKNLGLVKYIKSDPLATKYNISSILQDIFKLNTTK